ncbi:MAG: hypothetical protein ACM3NT_03390 [Methylocystaceae bacterium]
MNTYVVSACIDNRSENSPDFQAVLSQFSCQIRGRLGIPLPECRNGIVVFVIDGDEELMKRMESQLEAVPGTSINYMTV